MPPTPLYVVPGEDCALLVMEESRDLTESLLGRRAEALKIDLAGLK